MAGKNTGVSGAGVGTLRTITTLASSYFADYLRNPAMAASALIPVGAALLFRTVTGDMSEGHGTAQLTSWLDGFFTLYAFMFAGIMVTAMHVMYDMGEEAEKGGRGVLFRTGVTPGQLALGHLLAAGILLLLMCAASCAVLGVPLALGTPLTLLGFCCLLPLPITGCALALFARSQNDVLLTSTPLIVIGLISFVLYLEPNTFNFLIPLVPTGGMLGIAEALMTGDLLSGQGPVSLAMTALWLLVSIVILRSVLHRFRRTDL